MRTQTGGTRGPARETLGAWPSLLLTVLRADLYSSSVPTYSLDYQSMKTEKRGDSDLSRSRASCPVAPGESGEVVGGIEMCRFRAFQAQRTLVPYKKISRSSC